MIDSKKAYRSWALYDWANSAFATTVMAGFFPLFFSKYYSSATDASISTYYLGIANSVASIIVAALAPFLGAIADRGTAKKKFLFTFAFLGIIMTGGLWMVAQGQWQLAALFYILATVGFSGGNIFYDSLLPGVASKKKVDYVSSLGFGLGYIGGGVLFLINVLMYQMPHIFGIPDEVTAIKLSFLSVAIWWAVFSIPIFIWVEEPKIYDKKGIFSAVKLGWLQLLGTLKDIKHLKVVGIFLFAYWFYIDGVDTIVRMAIKVGDELGFESSSLIIALLLVQFIAFPCTLLYVKYSNKVGLKKAIMTGIVGYAIITFLGYFMTQTWHFFVLAAMIGLFQGGIQALSRSLYTRLIPKEKSAEFFGFYNMLGKFAAVLGPLMMGYITKVTGNVRIGVLSILVLFVIGGILLLKVDIEEGEKMAKEYLSK